MVRPPASRLVEDYLTNIWKAQEWGGAASTTELAATLGVTPSTVSSNLKKLARDGLLDYEPYGTIALAPAGRRIAITVVRRHRIIETYLHQELGLTWDQLHLEADALEHSISDLVLGRMDDILGHPTRDPHGDPIPTTDGVLHPVANMLLVEVPTGQAGTVVRVSDREPEILRYLADRGLTLDTIVTVHEANPKAQSLTITRQTDAAAPSSLIELSMAAASAVRVSPEPRPR